jgi:hypothetical protein
MTNAKELIMLLATYQPIDSIKNDVCRYPDLTLHFGYDPIFCFPARNAREAIFYSIVTNTTDHPEKLVIFEASEWDELDIVQWNRKLAIDYQRQEERMSRGMTKLPPMPIEECFTGQDPLYKCCLVKKIGTPIVEIDIKEMFFIDLDISKSEWKGFLNEVVRSAQQCALAICKNTNTPLTQETSWDNCNLMTHQMIKEGFQGLLLPLIYPIVLEKQISHSTYFNYKEYVRRMTLNKVSKLLSPNESIDEKTYERFNEIVRDVRACTTKTYDRTLSDGFNQTDTALGPNSICPCGSGKKYKKCCRQSTFEKI